MRTHYCGELNETHIGEEVRLCGWVHRRRDHGGVLFLDLRDRDGITQVVYDPDTEESFAIAEGVRSEFVVQVLGRVRARPDGTVNPDMPTGAILRLFSLMSTSMFMKTFDYDTGMWICVVRKWWRNCDFDPR